MRLPWTKREEISVDPNHRHAFRQKGGLGQVTVIMGGSPNVAVPGAVARTRVCAVCGRMRDDVIHAAEDD